MHGICQINVVLDTVTGLLAPLFRDAAGFSLTSFLNWVGKIDSDEEEEEEEEEGEEEEEEDCCRHECNGHSQKFSPAAQWATNFGKQNCVVKPSATNENE